MFPNKKDNNGWVLCPSKSIPGKFYYFNVVSGEAVWCLPDKKTEPTHKIHDVANKTHNFPEPKTPVKTPQESTQFPHNSDNVITPKKANTPSFGQISFPNYVPLQYDTPSSSNAPIFDMSNICTSNGNANMSMFQTSKLIWAPMPLMVMEPKTPKKLDQFTQTCEIERELFVHTCEKPLSKRFVNYEHPVLTKGDTKSVPFCTSTPLKNTILDPTVAPTMDAKRPIIRDPVLNINKKEVYQKSFEAYLNVKKNEHNENEELTLANLKLCDADKSCDPEMDEEDLLKLQNNDLRLFLMARKRRHTEGESDAGSSEIKKTKLIYRVDHAEPLSKKHVTFKLNAEYAPEPSQKIFKDLVTIQTLKDMAVCTTKNDWYVVVDTDVLLQDYEFINKFVQLDENCRLLIPDATRREIESLCSRDSFGNRHVFAARQITRMLKNPPRHVVVGAGADAKSIAYYSDTDMATNDAVLNCCMRETNERRHLILLSNNTDLLRKALSLHIQSYKLQTIKESVKLPYFSDLTSTNNVLSSNKLQPTASQHKEAFTRTQRMFQNIPNLNEGVTRTNQSRVFDDETVTSETSFDIGRVIQKINLKHNIKDNVTSSHEESSKCNQNMFQIQNGVPNSNRTNDNINDAFLFKKPCFINKQNGIKTTFQFQNSNSVPFENQTVDSSQMFDESDKNMQFPIQNLKIKEQPVLQKAKKKSILQHSNTESHEVVKNKNNTELSVENMLKRFEIKHKIMEDRIKKRIEEWICIFVQIMEDALSNVLQISSFRNDLTLPWTLREMLHRVEKLHEDCTLKIVAEKLFESMAGCVCDNGTAKKFIRPQDFVRTVGCGILLMECLMKIHPECEELANARQSLTNLLRTVEDPAEMEFVDNNTTRVNHIDIDRDRRQNHVKEPSEIINYLKRHYENWKNYEVSEDQSNIKNVTTTQEDPVIYRISGRNLNTLRIDSKKAITVVKSQNNESKTKVTENDMINKVEEKPTANKLQNIPPKLINDTIKTLRNRIIIIDQNDSKINLINNNKKKVKDVDVIANNGPKIMRRNLNQKDAKISSINNNNDNIVKDADISNNGLKIIRRYLNENDSNTNPINNNDNIAIDLDVTSNNGPKMIKRNLNKKEPKIDSINKNEKKLKDTDAIPNNRPRIIRHNQKEPKINSTNDNVTKEIKLNDGPKTTQRMSLIKAHEDKSNNKPLDMDILDYSDFRDNEIKQTTAKSKDIDLTKIITGDIKNNSANNRANKMNEFVTTSTKNYGKKAIDSNGRVGLNLEIDYISVSDSTSDSGIENEGYMTYTFVKTFLCELSATFKEVHSFINENIEEVRKDQSAQDKTAMLHKKVDGIRKHMADIIKKLKSIVQRETNDNVLNTLMIKIEEAAKDKRISRYRSVIRKCLEHAQNLQNALKIMLCITDDEFDGSMSIRPDSTSSSVRYLNIFE